MPRSYVSAASRRSTSGSFPIVRQAAPSRQNLTARGPWISIPRAVQSTAGRWPTARRLDHPPDIDDQVESGRRLARLLELPRELVELRLIRRVLLRRLQLRDEGDGGGHCRFQSSRVGHEGLHEAPVVAPVNGGLLIPSVFLAEPEAHRHEGEEPGVEQDEVHYRNNSARARSNSLSLRIQLRKASASAALMQHWPARQMTCSGGRAG